jgi:uncharacterized protein
MSDLSRGVFKWARTLHIYVSLLGFLMFLFFAVTGITLNHDSFGFDKVQSTTAQVKLPLAVVRTSDQGTIVNGLREAANVHMPVSQYSAQGDEINVAFAGPGKRVQVVIHAADGTADVTYESRGWAGLLADLHKGAESGPMWRAFLDTISAMLGFSSLTGIIMLLALPKRQRMGLLAATAGTVIIILIYVVWVPR